jgi:hypothetical protein
LTRLSNWSDTTDVDPSASRSIIDQYLSTKLLLRLTLNNETSENLDPFQSLAEQSDGIWVAVFLGKLDVST